MTIRKSALLTPLIAAAAIATAWIAPASALPLYHLTICGTAPGCEVYSPGGPGIGSDDIPTNDSFAQFYSWAPPGATFDPTIDGGTFNGFVYGTVLINGSDTEGFLAFNGLILQGYTPGDVTIAGINDYGVAIGQMLGEGIVLDLLNPGSVVELDEESQSLVFGDLLENSVLTGIDDDGRISGISGFVGNFQLTPVGLEPPVPLTDLPEPSSLVMLAGALGMLRWARGRDRGHT